MNQRFQQTNYGLGSDILLTIVCPESYDSLDDLYKKLWQSINEFEHRFSRFKSDSELSTFNSEAGSKVKISKQFADMLKASKTMAIKTGGLFNPFILPSLQKAGYKGSWPSPNNFDSKLNYEDRTIHKASSLVVGEGWAKIPENSAIDFGGIGKGFLLDLLTEQIPDEIIGYWFSIGGDLICYGKDIENEPWKIFIQNATSNDKQLYITNFHFSKMAVATSGVTKRKGFIEGREWHHIINPMTGRSAKTDILTATVVADNAVAADVYAKCLVILGSKKTNQFIADNDLPATSIQVSTSKDKLVTINTGEIH